MVLRFILLSSLLFSCVGTTELSDEVVGFAMDLELPECGSTILISKVLDNEWNDIDDSRIKLFRDNCRNLYSGIGCLKKIVKLKEYRYQTFCRGLD